MVITHHLFQSFTVIHPGSRMNRNTAEARSGPGFAAVSASAQRCPWPPARPLTGSEWRMETPVPLPDPHALMLLTWLVSGCTYSGPVRVSVKHLMSPPTGKVIGCTHLRRFACPGEPGLNLAKPGKSWETGAKARRRSVRHRLVTIAQASELTTGTGLSSAASATPPAPGSSTGVMSPNR